MTTYFSALRFQNHSSINFYVIDHSKYGIEPVQGITQTVKCLTIRQKNQHVGMAERG